VVGADVRPDTAAGHSHSLADKAVVERVHLTSIYHKLEINSRSQLAGALGQAAS
jgi:hypothetical protein